MATALEIDKKKLTKVFIYTSDHLNPGSSTFELFYEDFKKLKDIELIIRNGDWQKFDLDAVLNILRDIERNPSSIFIVLLGEYSLSSENYKKEAFLNKLDDIFEKTSDVKFTGVLVFNTVLPNHRSREYTIKNREINFIIQTKAENYSKVECTDIGKVLDKRLKENAYRYLSLRDNTLTQRGGEVIAKILITQIQASLAIILLNFRGNNFHIFNKKSTYKVDKITIRGPFDNLIRCWYDTKRKWKPWPGCRYEHHENGAHINPQTNELMFNGCYVIPPLEIDLPRKLEYFLPYLEFKEVKYDQNKTWSYNPDDKQFQFDGKYYETCEKMGFSVKDK